MKYQIEKVIKIFSVHFPQPFLQLFKKNQDD